MAGQPRYDFAMVPWCDFALGNAVEMAIMCASCQVITCLMHLAVFLVQIALVVAVFAKEGIERAIACERQLSDIDRRKQGSVGTGFQNRDFCFTTFTDG